MKWYKVITKDRRFVGELLSSTKSIFVFRIGLNDKLLLTKKEIITIKEVKGRDVETGKNGKYYTL